jgi:hypothetical protein
MPQSKSVPPLRTIAEVKPNTFIFEKHSALSAELCQQAIERFEHTSEEQYEGRIGQTVGKDRSIKKTTDLVVSGKPHWKDIDQALFRSLGQAILEFRETYPYFKGPFKDMGYGIQRYHPGEHYQLFPPFWTHEHRAVTLQKGVKYIATTWVVFA